MGFKGKAIKVGSKIVKQVGGKKAAAVIGGSTAAAGAAALAGGGGGGGAMGGGMRTGGLYRVTMTANGPVITKVSQKRRRKGYRMPAAVREQMRAATDLTKAVSMAVVAGAVGK